MADPLKDFECSFKLEKQKLKNDKNVRNIFWFISIDF